MSYGGIFKTVVRTVVPIAVSIVFPYASPLVIALSSAAATAATGGSFKESLMSGATSYIGAQVSQIANQAAIDAGTNALPTTFVDSTTGPLGIDIPVGGTIPGSIQQGVGAGLGVVTPPAELTGQLINQGAISQAIGGGISKFQTGLDNTFGGITEEGVTTDKTAFDVIRDKGKTLLSELGAVPGLGNIAPVAEQSITAKGIGGIAGLTLEQALLANTPEADAVLAEIGFTPKAIQLLKQEARNALSQGAFDRLSSETENPFGTEEDQLAEFNKVIASGIERENVALGPDITEQQFGNVFDDPGLGQSILDTEQGLRQQAYNQDIGTAFPGDVFQELDQSIIDSIVGERRGPAQEQVGRQEARGNLNPFGGQTANEFLSGQEPRIQERIGEVGGGVLDEARRGLGEIKDRASGAVNDFTLGDPAFDVTPFAEERQGFIDTETPLIGGSVRDVLSNEPLFDVRGALAEGGKTQGLVSGAPSASFLDTIAARQQAGTRERRGLGSRGSGAF